MNLSRTLFDNLTNKLKLDSGPLVKEKFYIENFINQIDSLKKTKTENHKQLGLYKFEQHNTIQNKKQTKHKYKI